MLAQALEENRPLVGFLAQRSEFGTAEADTLDQRMSRAPLRTVEAKEHVFTEGDQRSHLFRVESGAVCLYKVLPDGRRQVLGFAYPGDLLGFGPAGPHRLSAQTTRPSRIRCLPWKSIERAARQNPQFGLAVWELMAQEITAAHDLLLTIGQRTAQERVAAFLLAISRRNHRAGGEPGIVSLPMTRTDIGDLLALTIETVSRTLSRLRRQRVIDLAQGHQVRIRDIEALTRLATGGKE